ALAAFFAVAAAMRRAATLPTSGRRLAIAGLVVLGTLWGMRTLGTIETLRAFSARNQLEWMTQGPPRRREFAERPVYLSIMRTLIPQGTVEDVPRPTRYPGALATAFGPRPAAPAP